MMVSRLTTRLSRTGSTQLLKSLPLFGRQEQPIPSSQFSSLGLAESKVITGQVSLLNHSVFNGSAFQGFGISSSASRHVNEKETATSGNGQGSAAKAGIDKHGPVNEQFDPNKHNLQFSSSQPATSVFLNWESQKKPLFSWGETEQSKNETDQMKKKLHLFRPLSPHLPVYKPQLTSTFSILNRISGAFLTTIVLFPYILYLKIGFVCFTNVGFYQFLFYSSKLIPISVEIAALALSYHVYCGVRHLLTDFSGSSRLLSFRR